MFESLDTLISLGVVFLILSMVHKYLMSVVKRFFKIKAKTIAKEMKTFVGENTIELLVPYLEKNAKHLNFLENINGENVLRKLNKEQLKEIVGELEGFLEENDNDVNVIAGKLGINVTDIKVGIDEIKTHLNNLRNKVENMYDNTMEKMSEVYVNNIRMFTLYSGLALAFIVNANFFEIYNTLSKNSLVREHLVAQADVVKTQMTQFSNQMENDANIDKTIKDEIKDVKDSFSELTKTLENAGLELGWTIDKFKQIGKIPNDNKDDLRIKKTFLVFANVMSQLIGLCIAGLLISFGAPFWHDFIGTFMGLRKKLTGKKDGNESGTASQAESEEKKE